MSLLKYTTKIDVEKTVSEIQKHLGQHQAKAIMTNYDAGIIVSLSFQMGTPQGDIGFRLPCDWRPVLDILKNDKKVPRSLHTQEQAVRVAWRIVLAWVEAQMALIDTRMVRTEEVFLPYAIMRDGNTLAEHVQSGQLLLGNSQQ